jgi:hypothetical protein
VEIKRMDLAEMARTASALLKSDAPASPFSPVVRQLRSHLRPLHLTVFPQMPASGRHDAMRDSIDEDGMVSLPGRDPRLLLLPGGESPPL